MELLAAIKGLEALKRDGTTVRLHTDSQYLVNAVNNGWVFEWERKRFAKKKNQDLWISFLEVYRRHNVTLKWIKGHNNDTENERCDTLAVAASKKTDLQDDPGYITDDEPTALI